MFEDWMESFDQTQIEVDEGRNITLSQTDSAGETMWIAIPEWAWDHFVGRVNRLLARPSIVGSTDGR